MFTKLFSNILASIVKRIGLNTDYKDRNFDIRKSLFAILIALLFSIIVFLINRIVVLNDRNIALQQTIESCKTVKTVK